MEFLKKVKKQSKESMQPAPDQMNRKGSHMAVQRLRSLCFVPPLLALPFQSMNAVGAACSVLDDAGWSVLLGISLWYAWAEAMVRDVAVDIQPFARDVVARYRLGRTLSLPQQCSSLPALYQTIVFLDLRCIRILETSNMLGGRANLVLRSAAPGPHLPGFRVAESVA